jgi:hypothetical protein
LGTRFFVVLVGAIVAAMAALLVVALRRGDETATPVGLRVAAAAPASTPPMATLTPITAEPAPAESSARAASLASPPVVKPPIAAAATDAPLSATTAPTIQTARATAAPSPTCHIATTFDAEGNKHFKQECP